MNIGINENKMHKTRCVNCGIKLNERAGLQCKMLHHISGIIHVRTKITSNLVSKLEKWIHPEFIQPSNRLCEQCLACLRSRNQVRITPINICLGCGCCIHEGHEVTGTDLEVCRSWVPSGISVRHLKRICDSCYARLKCKTETEFIGVNLGPAKPEFNLTVEIKSEPNDYTETTNEQLISIETELPVAEEDPISQIYIKEENIDDGFTDIPKIYCEEAAKDEDSEYYSEVEYLSDSFNENVNETENTIVVDIEAIDEKPNDEMISSNKTKRKWGKKSDSDDEYLPKINIPPKKPVELEPDEESNEISLKNYKRTTRIGCCVFNNCKDDCVSLVPRTVRRRLAVEHNLYILRLSRVCAQHLQDQNWEELIPNATTIFTAEQCQDLKNVIYEACKRNFNFEHVENVNANLVRYWFDVNKTEFNNIFNQFPDLKMYKNAKTAFAVYLMHLQGESAKAISLLLRMSEKIVKRRIAAVKDIVKCDCYSQLRLKFLEDSDSE